MSCGKVVFEFSARAGAATVARHDAKAMLSLKDMGVLLCGCYRFSPPWDCLTASAFRLCDMLHMPYQFIVGRQTLRVDVVTFDATPLGGGLWRHCLRNFSRVN